MSWIWLCAEYERQRRAYEAATHAVPFPSMWEWTFTIYAALGQK